MIHTSWFIMDEEKKYAQKVYGSGAIKRERTRGSKRVREIGKRCKRTAMRGARAKVDRQNERDEPTPNAWVKRGGAKRISTKGPNGNGPGKDGGE